MSHWSIAEQTETRLVAHSIPRRAANSWTIKILQTAVIISAFCPGIASLISGSAVLPATAVCNISKANAGVMDCQVSRNFWGRVIRKENVYLPEVPAQQLHLQADGDTTMFYFGLYWLAGVSGTLGAIQLVKTRKTSWTFDQATDTIQKKPLAVIPKKAQIFDRSAINSLRLEIPDLTLNFFPASLSLGFNFKSAESDSIEHPHPQPLSQGGRGEPEHMPSTKLIPVESNKQAAWYKLPVSTEIYAAGHPELPEMLQSVVQPIAAILDLPWQLVFEHEAEQESFIFDFADRTITQQFQEKQVLRLSFDEISGFEAEEPDPFVNSLIQTEAPSVRRLNLLVGDGIRISIHQYAGFTDVATAEIWFYQLQAALQPHFPEADFTNKVPRGETMELIDEQSANNTAESLGIEANALSGKL
jgi:hypothetical protein